jgi:hypothetical protein
VLIKIKNKAIMAEIFIRLVLEFIFVHLLAPVSIRFYIS